MAAAMAALRELPAAEFSFVYTTGEREIDQQGVPEASEWAAKYACGPRRDVEEIVDTKGGYVFDSTRLNLLRPGWGLLPAPGKAKVYVFPDCRDGRVVADVVRLEKGHTEGLEPKVTERGSDSRDCRSAGSSAAATSRATPPSSRPGSTAPTSS
jgi:hypothetical protein